ncbi:MAG: hypothetical protein KKC68_08615, partial [Candidatus Thermoplasmatota archaeon]|nr:hypothetical protein [Candidatus Thermoplasmatota archaeon]
MKIETVRTTGIISNVSTVMEQLQKLGKLHQVLIQLVKADIIFSNLHVISAVEHAVRSFERGLNATGSLDLEVLLYLAGERQIHKAIAKAGIRKGDTEHVLIIVGDLQNCMGYFGGIAPSLVESIYSVTQITHSRDDIVGGLETLKRFGITNKELQTLKPSQYEGFILEKV